LHIPTIETEFTYEKKQIQAEIYFQANALAGQAKSN